MNNVPEHEIVVSEEPKEKKPKIPTATKTSTARFRLSPEGERLVRARLDRLNAPAKMVARLMLHGYEGRDDGLHAEFASTMPADEFLAGCALLRDGVMSELPPLTVPGEPEEMVTRSAPVAKSKKGKGKSKGRKQAKTKTRKFRAMSARELLYPLFSGNSHFELPRKVKPVAAEPEIGPDGKKKKAKGPSSFDKLRPFFGRLKQLGLLPLKAEGVSIEDAASLVKLVVQRVRSYIECDRMCRAEYAEQVKLVERLRHTADVATAIAAEHGVDIENITKDELDAGKGDVDENTGEELKPTVLLPERIRRQVGRAQIRLRTAVRRLEWMHPSSNLTLPGEHTLDLKLGSNYADFTLAQDGPYLTLEILRGALKGKYSLDHGARKKVTHMWALQVERQRFLESPEISTNVNNTRDHSEGKTDTQIKRKPCSTTIYRMKFSENGKRGREALLKEPTVHVRPSGAVYLQMPMTFETPLRTEFKANPALLMNKESVRGFSWDNPQFQRLWPKPVDGLEQVRNLRIFAVDLGLRPIAAYAVLEVSAFVDGLPKSIKCVHTGSIPRSKLGDEYAALAQRAQDLVRLIKHTRKWTTDAAKPKSADDAEPKKFWQKAADLRDETISAVFPDVAAYRAHVEQLPDDLLQWNRPGVWWCGAKLRELRAEFKACKSRRIKDQGNLTDEMAWQMLNRNLIQATKSFNKTGAPPLMPGDERDRTLCSRMHAGAFRHRLDLRRKLCRRLVDLAVSEGCSAIAAEFLPRDPDDLDTPETTRREQRDMNSLWDMWAPNMMLAELRPMARADGLAVVQVQSDLTSSVVYESESVGLRECKECKDYLWYADDFGEIKAVNADINAAKNIGKRALMRHAEPFRIWLTRDDKGRAIPADFVPAKTAGMDAAAIRRQAERVARAKAVMRHLFEDETPWRRFDDIAAGLDTREDGSYKCFCVYRHGRKLLTVKERRALRLRIKEARTSGERLVDEPLYIRVTAEPATMETPEPVAERVCV